MNNQLQYNLNIDKYKMYTKALIDLQLWNYGQAKSVLSSKSIPF